MALELMKNHKIEKLPVVQGNFIKGLINLRDIEREELLHMKNKDELGSLRVGAAVGAREEDVERARQLYEAGCDVLVVDIANGHSTVAIKAVERLK